MFLKIFFTVLLLFIPIYVFGFYEIWYFDKDKEYRWKIFTIWIFSLFFLMIYGVWMEL